MKLVQLTTESIRGVPDDSYALAASGTGRPIDVSIVVEYGSSIVEVSENIRRNVVNSVERATGLEVLEVNVNVTDVHLPGDDDEDDSSKSGTELE